MSAPTTVSAPGKIFLVGEYAVLEGGTAVVTAVDRHARGRFVPGGEASTPLVAEAARAARAHLTERGALLPDGAPEIDSSALSAGGKKLGLGSSAAAAAVAVGAMFEAAGRDFDGARDEIFAIADRAHRAIQGGRGSGADVAAAVYGGTLAFSRRPDAAPSIRKLTRQPELHLVVFSTGVPSATVDHVRAIERLAERAPSAHEARMRAVRVAADGFLRAWDAGDGAAAIRAADEAGTALEALGREADLPIVTTALAAAAELARQLGGAAKPSGAGGGDVGVAFLTDRDAIATFQERAPHIGVEILKIATSVRGLGRGALEP